MASTSIDARTTEARIDLASFDVHGIVYAIDVSHIREIVRWQELTPLPKAPTLIEGVVDLRGSVIPVVDLGRALGGDPVENIPGARIVILEADDLLFGLRVHAAIEVLSAEIASLDSPPALVTQAGYDAVRAVVRRPDAQPVLVLSIEHLLESVYRSALPQGEVSP